MTLDATIGGASSDTYGTLAEYQAYGASMGWTVGASDAADEVNLRRGAVAMDVLYSFIGTPQYETQKRAWPRVTGVIVDGWSIDIDTIPQAIKDAQFEAAYIIQGGTDPLAVVANEIGSESKGVGPLQKTVTYLGGKGRPSMVPVDRLLRDYITSGSGQARMARG